uniref:Paxillin n=1 Tax=Phallusia mammillata TaxID=59560 RepID=A0A6F9DPF5_9ASCI|nr:paxillin [Phallusia mammillata]
MDDLDALLQDLQATIPAQTTYGPNKNANHSDEFISDKISPNNSKTAAMSALEGNLSELDSLLEDLYSTDDAIGKKAPVQTQPPQFPSEPVMKPLTPPPKKKTVDIDHILGELESDSSSQMSNSHSPKKPNDSPTASASSAAQQLDDLMASLVDFKVPLRDSDSIASDKSDPPYAKPDKSRSHAIPVVQDAPVVQQANSNDLDEMLKDMNTDLVKQGIVPASKGSCGACGKPVMGEVTTALGKVWHPEHFVCVVCDAEIGTKTFFEREGKPYCEKDYHNLFSPNCAHCNRPVLGQCVTALNKTWHPEHFFCAMCSNFFGDDGFHEFEGKPYCRADYYNMFAPKCGGCLKPILSNYISALNAQWHPECFVCRECLAPFTNGSFFETDGQPYCEVHYHLLRGSLCSGCQKPITGRCITAMGKKFHPEHFVCAFCLKQLNKGTFKEQNEKPYCHQCFAKLFAAPNMG